MGSAVSGSHVTPGSSAVRELSLPRPQSESVFVFVCFRLPPSSSLWGVVSCKRAATTLVPRVPVFVFVCLRLRHSGVSLAIRELPLRSSPECLSLSSSVSVFVCIRLRHSRVSSAVRELPLRSSPERACLRLFPSSSASVFVTPRCRQL